MKKMIIIDLDNSLLNSRTKCEESSKSYLKKLKDDGYIIVIATGRTLASAIRVTGGAIFTNYIIASGGALIYDNESKQIIYDNTLNNNDVRNLYLKYKELFTEFILCDSNNYYKYSSIKELSYLDIEIKDVLTFLETSPILKHLTLGVKDEDKIYDFREKLNKEFFSLKFVVMQDSLANHKWIDVFCDGVSKYNAITFLSKLLNIANVNIIAFGDGLNDIDMISNCGVGVAMGNALKEVKEKALYVTLDCDNEGIITFLKEYLNNEK